MSTNAADLDALVPVRCERHETLGLLTSDEGTCSSLRKISGRLIVRRATATARD